jgi:hypothetical protein
MIGRADPLHSGVVRTFREGLALVFFVGLIALGTAPALARVGGGQHYSRSATAPLPASPSRSYGNSSSEHSPDYANTTLPNGPSNPWGTRRATFPEVLTYLLFMGGLILAFVLWVAMVRRRRNEHPHEQRHGHRRRRRSR